MDLSTTTAPKSNQLNADSFIAGPQTFRVARVAASGNDQQPVAIYFEGTNEKPYLPSKGMRRVLVAAWGKDSANYIGRRMTLFREPTVSYGGIQVGGIQISHLSDIQQDLNLVLTINNKKRVPYRVLRLQDDAPAPARRTPAPAPAATSTAPPPADDGHHGWMDGIRLCTTSEALAERRAAATAAVNAGTIRAPVFQRIMAAINARAAELTTTTTKENP